MKKILLALAGLLFSANAFAYTINGTLNLWGGNLNVYSDAGSTLKFKIDKTTGNFGFVSGAKFFLDGSALAGDDYWTNSGNGVNELWAGGVKALYTNSSGNVITGNGLYIPTNNFLKLDGVGGDDYWINSSNGVNELWAAGTKALYTNSSGNVITGNGLYIPTGNVLKLDGVGGDDYWINSSNGVNELYSANTLTIRTNSNGEVLFTSVDPPTANYANRNSIAKMWLYEDGNTPAIKASYNVASINRSGTGIYDITLSTAFSSTNYAILGSIPAAGWTAACIVSSASVIRCETFDATQTHANAALFSVTAFGTQ